MDALRRHAHGPTCKMSRPAAYRAIANDRIESLGLLQSRVEWLGRVWNEIKDSEAFTLEQKQTARWWLGRLLTESDRLASAHAVAVKTFLDTR